MTGHETGWWDESGRPAPWPEDFWLTGDTVNPAWTMSTGDPDLEDDHTDDTPY